MILIGTGSEVSLCVDAYESQGRGNQSSRSEHALWELFEPSPNPIATRCSRRRSPGAWRSSLASSSLEAILDNRPVYRPMGFRGLRPHGVLLKHFGITVENVVAAAKKTV